MPLRGITLSLEESWILEHGGIFCGWWITSVKAGRDAPVCVFLTKLQISSHF